MTDITVFRRRDDGNMESRSGDDMYRIGYVQTSISLVGDVFEYASL